MNGAKGPFLQNSGSPPDHCDHILGNDTPIERGQTVFCIFLELGLVGIKEQGREGSKQGVGVFEDQQNQSPGWGAFAMGSQRHSNEC